MDKKSKLMVIRHGPAMPLWGIKKVHVASQIASVMARVSGGAKEACADRTLNYIPELDGLRAIAICAVLLNHTVPDYFTGGFVGVDVFFVLSGYLITTILCHEFKRTNSIQLGQFYARRALRLMPALFAMLAVYTLLAIIYKRGNLGDPFVHEHATAATAAALYFMNWTHALDLGPSGLLLHTWSLAAEEQFYLCWPIILIIFLRLFGSNSAWKAVLIVIMMTMAWRVLLTIGGSSSHRIYNGFDTRIDTLLIGCLLALAPLDHIKPWAVRLSWCPVLALAIMSVTLVWTSRHLYTLGFSAIGLCAAWTILVALSAKSQCLTRQFLRWTPLTYCGRISYGIYLWHYPISFVAAYHFSWPIAFPITVIMTFLIASISYHLLEVPFLRLRRAFPPRTTSQSPSNTPHIHSFPVALPRQGVADA